MPLLIVHLDRASLPALNSQTCFDNLDSTHNSIRITGIRLQYLASLFRLDETLAHQEASYFSERRRVGQVAA